MPPRPTRRLSPDAIEANRTALLALRNIRDYAPHNGVYSVDALTALETALREAEQARMQAQHALDAARDRVAAATLALHEALLGAKAQVLAQYGPDSYEVQAIGLKRKSDRKRPARRAAPAGS
jgi:hypothetical protein